MAPVSPAGPPPITATSKVRTMAPTRASFALFHFSRRQRVEQMQRLAIEIGKIELRVLGIHDRRTISRMAKAERVADLVSQNLADLARREGVPIAIVEGDDDIRVRDPGVLIREPPRLANAELIRGKAIDPAQHDVRVGRIIRKRETDGDAGRLPLEKNVSRGLHVPDPPIGNVRVRLDPDAKAGAIVRIVGPAEEHGILRCEHVEDVRPLRGIGDSAPHVSRIARRNGGARRTNRAVDVDGARRHLRPRAGVVPCARRERVAYVARLLDLHRITTRLGRLHALVGNEADERADDAEEPELDASHGGSVTVRLNTRRSKRECQRTGPGGREYSSRTVARSAAERSRTRTFGAMMLVASWVWSRPRRWPISWSAIARIASSSSTSPWWGCTARMMFASVINHSSSRAHLVRPLIGSLK